MENKGESLLDEIFITITDANFMNIIPQFCDEIFLHDLMGVSLKKAIKNSGHNKPKSWFALKQILEKLTRPFTIIQEVFYVDSSFRDTYYMYFSNQHFDVKRYSRRLSFIQGSICFSDFFSTDNNLDIEIENNFMGSCVINPTVNGSVGRTLINPKYLMLDCQMPIYLRLSKFTIHVYGREFHIEAFPYRMQDEETMRCAEVSTLNIIEYFSNTYHDYRSVLPSEITSSNQKHNHERVLPSRGMPYPILTKVFSDFGYSPRLYNLYAIDKFPFANVDQNIELKRLLHYYIESGLPVAVNLISKENESDAHSVVCIGHGKRKEELLANAQKNKNILWEERDNGHPLINAADLYDEYVIVDDNVPVYQVRKYNQLTSYSDMYAVNLAVPLYKRMFLDAPNAYATVTSLLRLQGFRIEDWVNGYLELNENIVIRLYMASSRKFKSFRRKNLASFSARVSYSFIPMPRFIWVCELYKTEDFITGNGAFGEIVLDATSAPNRSYRSIIMLHYPGIIAYRDTQELEAKFTETFLIENDELLVPYGENLKKIP